MWTVRCATTGSRSSTGTPAGVRIAGRSDDRGDPARGADRGYDHRPRVRRKVDGRVDRHGPLGRDLARLTRPLRASRRPDCAVGLRAHAGTGRLTLGQTARGGKPVGTRPTGISPSIHCAGYAAGQSPLSICMQERPRTQRSGS